jgi:hypothetical protein
MPDYVADFAFRAKITFYAPAPPGRERLPGGITQYSIFRLVMPFF